MTLGGGSKDEVEAGLPCVVWVLVYINKVSHQNEHEKAILIA